MKKIIILNRFFLILKHFQKILSFLKNEIILKTPMVIFLSEKHTFSKESKLIKLPFIKSYEIKNVILKLMSIEKKNFFFEIKKFDNDLFLIKKTTNKNKI